MSKSWRWLKSDLTTIDFDGIDVREVNYLRPSYDGDVFFLSPLVLMGILGPYGYSMNDMDKMCVGRPWCARKITNIQNNFEFSLRHLSCDGHL